MQFLRGFHFGTYGRVGASADLAEGSRAKPLNVISHGPRLEEPSYLELDLGYQLVRPNGMSFKVLTTVGFLDDLLHYTGKFSVTAALRNLYAEAFWKNLAIWVGSRMYRGDDIYLLDFWPLDNLNTVGGGVRMRFGQLGLALHVGMNRLDDPFQYQRYPVPGAVTGTTDVAVLDRQKVIVSARGSYEWPGLLGPISAKAVLYTEAHALPSGTRRRELELEALPADAGWLIGAQLGLWTKSSSFLNVWTRGAGGLAAFNELAVPTGLDLEKKSSSAREWLLAVSGGWEQRWGALMYGGYLRKFRNANGVADFDDGWEVIGVARPIIYINRHFQQAFEVSLQSRRPDGLAPQTQTHLWPTVFKASVMPLLSWDRGMYTRPQLRLIYTISYLDEGARMLFPVEDPRHGVAVHHFIGAQAEWWYNSSYR
jgi:maltoporin